jgi:hypothetical protein
VSQDFGSSFSMVFQSENEMKHRRKFLHLAAGVAALPVVSNITRAQTYPWRPVHIIVGFTAGSATTLHRVYLRQIE